VVNIRTAGAASKCSAGNAVRIRILIHRTIRIRPNSLKPLFGTPLDFSTFLSVKPQIFRKHATEHTLVMKLTIFGYDLRCTVPPRLQVDNNSRIFVDKFQQMVLYKLPAAQTKSTKRSINKPIS